jgi:hypothetical protein
VKKIEYRHGRKKDSTQLKHKRVIPFFLSNKGNNDENENHPSRGNEIIFTKKFHHWNWSSQNFALSPNAARTTHPETLEKKMRPF